MVASGKLAGMGIFIWVIFLSFLLDQKYGFWEISFLFFRELPVRVTSNFSQQNNPPGFFSRTTSSRYFELFPTK
jgi:hypothetical protein